MPFKDADDTAFGGAAAGAFPGDAHQDAIAIPGVVELVITDIDVFLTVFAQGKAEALGGTAQAGRDQIGGLQATPALS